MVASVASHNAQLFTWNFFSTESIRTYKSSCAICEKSHFFDGRVHGVVNFNNRYLIDVGISHNLTKELFGELMELKLNDGTSTHAWWKAKVEVNLRTLALTEEELHCRRKLWMGLTSSLTSFASEFLTIVEYPPELFRCCESPEVVSTDGCKIAYPRFYAT